MVWRGVEAPRGRSPLAHCTPIGGGALDLSRGPSSCSSPPPYTKQGVCGACGKLVVVGQKVAHLIMRDAFIDHAVYTVYLFPEYIHIQHVHVHKCPRHHLYVCSHRPLCVYAVRLRRCIWEWVYMGHGVHCQLRRRVEAVFAHHCASLTCNSMSRQTLITAAALAHQGLQRFYLCLLRKCQHTVLAKSDAVPLAPLPLGQHE